MQLSLFFVVVLLIPSVALGKYEISKECGGKPADIVFVLDESTSIWRPDFRDRQLQFVRNMVDMFEIGSRKTQVGVVTFSYNVKNRFYLRTYKNARDIKSAVTAIGQRMGGTKTYLAISFLRRRAFSAWAGARKNVPHIGIILTDGASDNFKETAKEAMEARKAGIKLFVLGIGHRVNETECKAIASDPVDKYYINVTNFGALQSFQMELAYKACDITTKAPSTTTTTTTKPTTTTTLPQMTENCRGLHTIDAVFSLSENSKSRDKNVQIDFIKSLASGVAISPEKIQFGMGKQSCSAKDAINLGDCGNKIKLYYELEKRKWRTISPGARIKSMRESFTPSKGARGASVKFGILIVDENLQNVANAIHQSEYAKDDMELIVISVGNDVLKDEDTLKELATSSSHYFHVSDYAKLQSLNHKIEELFCNGIKFGRKKNYAGMEMEIFS